jgi:hypothetical protein
MYIFIDDPRRKLSNFGYWQRTKTLVKHADGRIEIIERRKNKCGERIPVCNNNKEKKNKRVVKVKRS